MVRAAFKFSLKKSFQRRFSRRQNHERHHSNYPPNPNFLWTFPTASVVKIKKKDWVSKFQASWKQFSMVLLLVKFSCIIPKETVLRRHFWGTSTRRRWIFWLHLSEHRCDNKIFNRPSLKAGETCERKLSFLEIERKLYRQGREIADDTEKSSQFPPSLASQLSLLFLVILHYFIKPKYAID